MKEIILLFVGSYKDFEIIPTLKEKVKEYLGNRMISDDCSDSPMLKLNQSLDASDVSNICQMISSAPGSTLSILYIKGETEEESQMLSRLMIELKPIM